MILITEKDIKNVEMDLSQMTIYLQEKNVNDHLNKFFLPLCMTCGYVGKIPHSIGLYQGGIL